MLFDLLDSLFDLTEDLVSNPINRPEPVEGVKQNQDFLEGTNEFLGELEDFFSEIEGDLEGLTRDFLELGGKMTELGDNAQTSLKNHLSSFDTSSYHSFALSESNPPKMGDHLMTNRLGFTHHGLYAGNDLVIHYEKGTIHYDTMEHFQKNMDTYILPESESPLAFSLGDVIKRAQSRLGEATYQLIFNNCEHFVRWCRSGSDNMEKSTSSVHDVEVIDIYECN